MVDLTFDVIASDRGSSAVLNKLANNFDKVSHAAKKTEDAQLKLSAATVKGKKAALDLDAAQAHLAKVTTSSKSSDEQKARAQLAVSKAQLAVAKSSRDVSRATEELTSATKKSTGSILQSHSVLLGVGVAATGGALALRKIIGASMDFDKAMSGVAAVAGASAAELLALRQAALDAGRDTAFSASDAARAEGELAKAGVSTADILGGALRGSLSLAAAGQLDLGDSATIAAQAMNIFNLKGTDVAHIADVLAAGANKSAADVSQLGQAMQQGGLVASQFGIGFDETIGTLAAFADNALSGSDAGVSLKTMLLALASPSGVAAKEMARLGINAYDATGQFVGLEGLAGILQSRLGKLTDEQRNSSLSIIFGNDAIRSANVLYGIGSTGVADYTKAVNDTGAAGRNAGTQMNNLSGDLEALRGSIETALIKTGSSANTVLRFMAQQTSVLVNAFSNLPAPVQTTALAILALGTAGTAALTVFGAVVPKVKAARVELAAMGAAGTRANQAIGLAGKAVGLSIPVIGIATAAWQIWSSQQRAAQQRASDLAAAIKEDSGALGEHTRAAVVDALEQRGALKVAQDAGISTATFTDAVLGNTDAQRKLFDVVRSGKGDTFAIIAAYNAEHAAVDDGTTSAKRKAEAEKGATTSAKSHTIALKDVTGAMAEQKTVADQLKEAIDGLNGANLTAGETDNRYRTSLLDLRDAIKNNGKSLDLQTAKTDKQKRSVIANRDAVFSAIRAAEDNATAIATQTGSVIRGNAAFALHVKALRATLAAAGVLPAAIDRIIAEYAQIPKAKKTRFEINHIEAINAANRIRAALNRVRGKKVDIQVSQNNTVQRVQHDIDSITGKSVSIIVNGKRIGYSEGGTVTGGTPGKDSVPALLTPGERVLTVAENRAYSMGKSVPFSTGRGGVLVSPGAVQVTFSGPVSRDTLPDIHRVVDAALNRLRSDLVAGRRR